MRKFLIIKLYSVVKLTQRFFTRTVIDFIDKIDSCYFLFFYTYIKYISTCECVGASWIFEKRKLKTIPELYSTGTKDSKYLLKITVLFLFLHYYCRTLKSVYFHNVLLMENRGKHNMFELGFNKNGRSKLFPIFIYNVKIEEPNMSGLFRKSRVI